MTKSACSERLQRVVTFFETLDRAAVARIDAVYANDVWFKDPFNEVKGIAAVTHIFEHMFVQVDEPRFVIHYAVEQGDAAFLTWDFHFRMKRFDAATVQTVRGASHLMFAPDGRVVFHRDYWDAAEELYEKLPLVGSLMRWLKRQAG
jgi:steroid Delta-isomerase